MATTYAASDALDAYLFECDDDALYAVSLDPLGANIPRRSCLQGWRRIAEFALGVHEPMPVAIDPETVLQGILLGRVLHLARGQEALAATGPTTPAFDLAPSRMRVR